MVVSIDPAARTLSRFLCPSALPLSSYPSATFAAKSSRQVMLVRFIPKRSNTRVCINFPTSLPSPFSITLKRWASGLSRFVSKTLFLSKETTAGPLVQMSKS